MCSFTEAVLNAASGNPVGPQRNDSNNFTKTRGHLYQSEECNSRYFNVFCIGHWQTLLALCLLFLVMKTCMRVLEHISNMQELSEERRRRIG